MIRPRWRMPVPLAFALLAAAWIVRSLLRGGDFGLDIPEDLIALGAVTIGAGAVWILRRSQPSDDGEDHAAHDDERDEDGRTGDRGDAHEI